MLAHALLPITLTGSAAAPARIRGAIAFTGLLRGFLLAHLAEDLADAFAIGIFIFPVGSGRQRRTRGARQRGHQFRGDLTDRDLLLDIGLDVRQAHGVHLAGEADRVTLFTQARGAADAMHVVLGIEGQVVVVDVLDPGDMQAARGDIGGHEDFELAGLEAAQQAFALFLRHIARQHADAVAGLFQRPRHAFDEHLGIDEHHGARALAARQQAQQQRQFFLVGGEIHRLAYPRGGDRLGFDNELFRLVHVLVGQFQHAVRQRRREQQGLARGARRHASQQEADVLDEAKVEHAVGLVQDADLAGVQTDHLVLLDVIDQPAGGGDDDVGTSLQQGALLVVVHPAVDQGELETQVGGELDRVLVDLDRQLASRRQDQRARIFRLALGQRRLGKQAIDGGHQEGQGLAGAGLGLTGDVAPGQRHGQGHRLDRRAAGETRLIKAGQQGRRQRQAGKGDVGQRIVAHGFLRVRSGSTAGWDGAATGPSMDAPVGKS